MVRLVIIFLVAAAITGCSTSEVKIAHSVRLESVSAPYAETELLDLAVVVFDSGVPEGEVSREVVEELMRDGTFIQIRRAEAMFLAVKLRETLQNSGHWGSVWVTPRSSTAVDLNVRAEILHSDGNIVELTVTAEDGTGRAWFRNEYEMETAASAYNRQRYPGLDPYQDVLNEIANDLARYRAGLDAESVADIRTIGELRYAGELSPDAFGEYLVESDGVFEPERLPAVGDPMLQRTRSVRQREQLFFETLDQHYEEFMLSASESYDSWREYSREDSIRMQEAARAARLRTGLGALAIAMSIAYGAQSDNNSLADRIIADAGIYVGGDLLRSAAVRRQERRLHTQSLQELSEDFEDSVEPLVVEIQGTQHRLTGSANAQYDEWQGLIRDLFISETGFVAEDIELYADPAEEADEVALPDAASTPASGSEIQEATTDASGGTEADA